MLAVPFDKGVGICLMTRETYKNKMNDILKLDQFEKLEKPRENSKNFVIKKEERINEELIKLRDSQLITEEF